MTTYSRVPGSPAMLAYVWEHLWARGKEEFARLGISESEALQRVTSYLQYENGCLQADGVPVCVFGMCPDGDTWCTWFQATDAFDEHAAEVTSYLYDENELRPQITRVYSVLVHPKAEKWFRCIGFERDGWESTTPAGYPLYRFARKHHVPV